ncbi:hypothetical protein [Haloferax larsenii]|uniref:hypothetical protein n=1 Tax=Haloferax larsenii TaxID=302484 RepID=UPI00147AEBA3|nr:hypothetical protein [Haloferax larsenii]
MSKPPRPLRNTTIRKGLKTSNRVALASNGYQFILNGFLVFIEVIHVLVETDMADRVSAKKRQIRMEPRIQNPADSLNPIVVTIE